MEDGGATGLQCSALARGTHRARTRGAEKAHAALKNGQKRDFWPFNGQFLGIETIDPPFLLARSGPAVAAHLLAKSPQNVTDRKETPFLNYSYRCRALLSHFLILITHHTTHVAHHSSLITYIQYV